jgi:hypothetical protein
LSNGENDLDDEGELSSNISDDDEENSFEIDEN